MGTAQNAGLITVPSAKAAFANQSTNPGVAAEPGIVIAGRNIYESIPRIFHTTVLASLERSVTTALVAWKSMGVHTPFALPVTPELLDDFAKNLDEDLRFEEMHKHVVLGAAFIGAEQRRELLRCVAAYAVHLGRHDYSDTQSVMLHPDCNYLRTELFDEDVIKDYNFEIRITDTLSSVEDDFVEDAAIEEDLEPVGFVATAEDIDEIIRMATQTARELQPA